MAESERKRETNHISVQINTSPRDLLQRFISEKNNFPTKFEEEEEEEEENIELNLGLSLNGRFGIDPKRPKTIIRSSSISDFTLIRSDNNNNRGAGAACLGPFSANGPPLARTCSLPTDTEEMEWRKRKEIQSLRRMEAKRKRVEKLKNVRPSSRDQEKLEENGIVQQSPINNTNGFEVLPPKPLSQGSIGSHGSGGSSGISEFESQPTIQGMNKLNEARSPASVHSLPEKNEQKPPLLTRGSTLPAKFSITPVENASMKVTITDNGAKDTVRNVMLDMPCVSTRGDGPNGKRIEGFLYRYRKGEEVRIVCVCHGSFLSPAEFVKHAGGSDVAHPLRHIVVNPPSPL